MVPPLRFADFCCGMGSFHKSFIELGWMCVAAADIDEAAAATYEHHFGIKPHGDIRDIKPDNLPDYDVLYAGFPCQPFSTAGKRKGFQGPQGNVFDALMTHIRFKKPKICIFENVRGLLSNDDGRTYKTIVKKLRCAGYTVQSKLLRCSNYGLPQRRERLFIVAVHQSAAGIEQQQLMDFGAYEKHVTLSQFMRKPFKRITAYTIRCGGRKSGLKDRHNWDTYEVGRKKYTLTLGDCLKLQGFRARFVLKGSTTQKWRQVGNTIPTIFTEMVGKNIQAALKKGGIAAAPTKKIEEAVLKRLGPKAKAGLVRKPASSLSKRQRQLIQRKPATLTAAQRRTPGRGKCWAPTCIQHWPVEEEPASPANAASKHIGGVECRDRTLELCVCSQVPVHHHRLWTQEAPLQTPVAKRSLRTRMRVKGPARLPRVHACQKTPPIPTSTPLKVTKTYVKRGGVCFEAWRPKPFRAQVRVGKRKFSGEWRTTEAAALLDRASLKAQHGR